MTNAIKAIDRASVHRICSGQVVLNLAMAVKELVENSIDAGARNVGVRLVEYGSKLVEVLDDGEGVEEANFEGLCLKYHTSKLREFSDLEQVGTYGFRGEALSSLCALSDVTVSTCHRTAFEGTQLKLDHSGCITAKTVCAREQGTTVSLHNLFSTLPVRRREFMANLKREFNKMATLLMGFCLSATGISIVCTNILENGRKQTVLSSQGASSVRESIATLFGSKEVAKLLEIRQQAPSSEVLEAYSLSAVSPEDVERIRVEGYVSSCAHGSGRSSADRQFFAVNRRPCELPKLAKVVNATYHMFNRHQYPFVYLNIMVERDAVDINVTPDKRSILIHRETLLLAIVKSSLLTMFRAVAGTYERQNTTSPFTSLLDSPTSSSSAKQRLQGALPSTPKSSPGNRSHTEDSTPQRNMSFLLKVERSRQPKRSLSGSPFDNTLQEDQSISDISLDSRSTSSPFTPSNIKRTKEDVLETTGPSPSQPKAEWGGPRRSGERLVSRKEVHEEPANCTVGSYKRVDTSASRPARRNIFSGTSTKGSRVPGLDALRAFRFKPRAVDSGGESAVSDFNEEDPSQSAGNAMDDEVQAGESDVIMQEDAVVGSEEELEESQPSASRQHGDECQSVESEGEAVLDVDEPSDTSRRQRTLEFSLARLVGTLQDSAKGSGDGSEPRARKFRAGIEPKENAAAEKELEREISKDSFVKMEVIGQFNLGFIIVRLEDDLFIVDQHAADEKYNFEMLQRHTVMETQKLLFPQEVELTAVNEEVLLENMAVFEANGFGFTVDDSRPAGRRVALASVPVTGSSQFGKEDVDELIFMLSDNPHAMCRPSKVQQMFAMKACRKSVMIGTPLTKAAMQKVVGHLGELDHPWNCPHGRPTMRHLVSLASLP